MSDDDPFFYTYALEFGPIRMVWVNCTGEDVKQLQARWAGASYVDEALRWDQ